MPFCALMFSVQLHLSEPAGVTKTKLMNSPTSPCTAPAWFWRKWGKQLFCTPQHASELMDISPHPRDIFLKNTHIWRTTVWGGSSPERYSQHIPAKVSALPGFKNKIQKPQTNHFRNLCWGAQNQGRGEVYSISPACRDPTSLEPLMWHHFTFPGTWAFHTLQRDISFANTCLATVCFCCQTWFLYTLN